MYLDNVSLRNYFSGYFERYISIQIVNVEDAIIQGGEVCDRALL